MTAAGRSSRRPIHIHLAALAVTFCLSLLLWSSRAEAQFSARDGYTPDGAYKWGFELAPYVWLPAASVKFDLGPRGGISGSGGTGVPSASELADSLHGAFMGFALVRYGPWSAELDLQWVDASEDKDVASTALGRSVKVSGSASYVRVAPGLGYQIYSGSLGTLPVTVDARVGFAYFDWSGKITPERNLIGGASGGGSFVQPWIGTRIMFYPATDWRVELSALGQGFGVDGGSWGWGASVIASYSVNRWLTLNAGFRALNSTRSTDDAGPTGRGRRSLDFTAYGPVIGVGFRF